MRFDNEFSVGAPIDEVWDTLLDVERVAPCMPGAQVLERTGDDSYRAAIKVKLGPVSMQYRGDIEVAEKDASAHRAKMHAKAKETRGQGTATADVQMQLDERDGQTHATLSTDLALSGRAAAMGQRFIPDVSAKLVDTFAENLAAMLGGGPAEEAPTAEAKAPAAAPPRPSASPSAESELPALEIAASVAADRLRDPRTLLAAAAAVFAAGYLLGRARG